MLKSFAGQLQSDKEIGSLGEALEELVWLAYDVRFGGEAAEPRAARARELLDVVRDAA